jgi:nicotinamidase/pyrazinamidase
MAQEGSALVIVDFQKDFTPGGSLAVGGGDSIADNINLLISEFAKKGLPIMLTRDWHPKDHCSFKENGGIWSAHCVQNTEGAKFHERMNIPEEAVIIDKGTDPKKEAYSGFSNPIMLEALKEKGVNKVFVCGLATDYCVKNTADDALKLKFETVIVTDCIKGVDVNRGDSERALEYLRSEGAKETRTNEIITQTKKAKIRI